VHATEIVRQRHLEEDEMKQLLLPTVLQMLRDSSDEDVVDGWMLTLLELMPLLDRATLVRAYTSSQCVRPSPMHAFVAPEPPVPVPVQEHDVASLALAKGEVDQQVTSRALCCRILGGLAPHVDAAFIQRRFLNKAMASCQDTDYEVRVSPPVRIVSRARMHAQLLIGIWGPCMGQVRICMCNQLDAIARSVGNTLLHDTVLPEVRGDVNRLTRLRADYWQRRLTCGRARVLCMQLMELLNDEEVAVRTAAFIGLVKMFEILGKDQAAMYLIITRFVVADDEPTQLCIAQQFGPLILQVLADPIATSCFAHQERNPNWRE
jgi:hypothetical protein